jgi:hypothetical protein
MQLRLLINLVGRRRRIPELNGRFWSASRIGGTFPEHQNSRSTSDA